MGERVQTLGGVAIPLQGGFANADPCHLQHKMAEKARLCFTERSTLGSKDRSGSSSQKEF